MAKQTKTFLFPEKSNVDLAEKPKGQFVPPDYTVETLDQSDTKLSTPEDPRVTAYRAKRATYKASNAKHSTKLDKMYAEAVDVESKIADINPLNSPEDTNLHAELSRYLERLNYQIENFKE